MVTIKKDGTATRMPGDKPRYNPTPGPWEVNSGMVQTVSGIPIAKGKTRHEKAKW